jgi:hypothetical protein
MRIAVSRFWLSGAIAITRGPPLTTPEAAGFSYFSVVDG